MAPLSGSNYYVRILSTIDRELLKPNASVALHKHSNALVDVLPPEADSSIMMLTSGKTLSTTLLRCCNSSSTKTTRVIFRDNIFSTSVTEDCSHNFLYFFVLSNDQLT